MYPWKYVCTMGVVQKCRTYTPQNLGCIPENPPIFPSDWNMEQWEIVKHVEIIYNSWFSLAVITTNISLIKFSLGFVPSIFRKCGSCYVKERPTIVLSFPKAEEV